MNGINHNNLLPSLRLQPGELTKEQLPQGSVLYKGGTHETFDKEAARNVTLGEEWSGNYFSQDKETALGYTCPESGSGSGYVHKLRVDMPIDVLVNHNQHYGRGDATGESKAQHIKQHLAENPTILGNIDTSLPLMASLDNKNIGFKGPLDNEGSQEVILTGSTIDNLTKTETEEIKYRGGLEIK